MRPTAPILGVLLGFAVQTSVPADIINVPGDQPTIQAGIDAASDGDAVVVAPGSYNEVINFLGKAITLRSAKEAEVTTIDGTGFDLNSVVTCNSGEGSGTVLSGFVVTGGTGSSCPLSDSCGGGMFNFNSSPTATGRGARHGDRRVHDRRRTDVLSAS